MNKHKGEVLYLVVSHDKYEFPLCVGTLEEISEYSKASINSIRSAISKYEHGNIDFTKFRRVFI